MWDTLITNPMLNSLLFIYSLVGQNFGIALILFTIIVRLITHPLTVKQLKSSAAMQEMQKSKRWQDIQKKYKDDKEKLQQEQMKLYQEMGVNPFSSCLPMFIQFPIMIGLYQALMRALAVTPNQLLDMSSHIYPFVDASRYIPINSRFLWMDLAEPERLYILGVGIPVLAVLVVITTYVQSKLITPGGGGAGDQGAAMAQSMNLMMPLMMGYFAFAFSAGLALYFLVGNIIGIIQYAALGKANWQNILPMRKAGAK
jgi:YidC/Oxa1 family membrane protein insertase